MKKYHIGVILSVVTGKLLSVDGIRGLCEILSFMTGESIYTHQIGRAMDDCKPALLEQYPKMKDIELEIPDEKEDILAWVKKQEEVFGELLDVKPITTGIHEPKDPVSELIEMMDGEDGITVVHI